MQKPIINSVDSSFICSDEIYHTTKNKIEQLLEQTNDFDVSAFLRGTQEQDAFTLNKNESLFQEAVDRLTSTAAEIAKQITPKDPPIAAADITQLAYKQLLGVLDKYDQLAQEAYKSNSLKVIPSTFMVRSALLVASQNAGANLESWMVYTKGNKPESKELWTFLKYWNNWTPEAQGVMAKFTEATWIKTRQLSIKQNERRVLLLKGGFGAGKTTLAKELFAKSASGVVAPDAAKQVVRRSLREASHASAHNQGSQLAYSLFDDFIKSLSGTIAYDSSLSRPSDVENYLAKAKQAGKKMEIHDVARNDIARSLAVLRREVSGEDPRIPPDRILASALLDKMKRVECMEVILNDTTEDDSLRPEYHLYGANSQGSDRKEILVLSSKQKADLTQGQESIDRLLLEGIEVDKENKKLVFNIQEDELKTYYQKRFDQPVKNLVEQELSEEEAKLCQETFSTRIFPLDPGTIIDSPETLYQALDETVR